jgi:outer membrane immunogenic protein
MKNEVLRKAFYSGLLIASMFSGAVYADPAPASINWAGPYIGGHGGYAWGDFRNSAGVAGPDGSGDSWLGGAQIGTNWQFNRLVLGVEGDASKMDILTKNPSSTFDEDWMATARGRAGYSLDQMLPYVTVGLGLTDTISKVPGVGSDSSVQPGVAAGAGVDFMLPKMAGNTFASGNWVGRIEYLNVDVPKNTENVGGTAVRGGSNNNIVRVGLNYKF